MNISYRQKLDDAEKTTNPSSPSLPFLVNAWRNSYKSFTRKGTFDEIDRMQTMTLPPVLHNEAEKLETLSPLPMYFISEDR